jgi:hypothetical protein
MVSGFIGSLKVMFTALLIQTPTAAAAGFVEVTVGGVISGLVPVVKVQASFAAR